MGEVSKKNSLNFKKSKELRNCFYDLVERMRLELITSTLPVSRSSQMS